MDRARIPESFDASASSVGTEYFPDAPGRAPGLEIKSIGVRLDTPSIGGQSHHSVAMTVLSQKGLEGTPIAQKRASSKDWLFLDSIGNEITKQEVKRIGIAWYQDSLNPSKGRLRDTTTGQFVKHAHARSIITGGSDIAVLSEAEEDTMSEPSVPRVGEEVDLSVSKSMSCTLLSGLAMIALMVVAIVATGGSATHMGLLVHVSPTAWGLAKHDLQTSGATSGARSVSGFRSRLSQELSQLLAEEEQHVNEEGSQVQLLEYFPTTESSEPTLKQKALAVLEIDRILTSRHSSEILGKGTMRQQQQEFLRIARLLHPDKGFVSADDQRASLALRLTFAARRNGSFKARE